jgi:hypothetical protein
MWGDGRHDEAEYQGSHKAAFVLCGWEVGNAKRSGWIRVFALAWAAAGSNRPGVQ